MTGIGASCGACKFLRRRCTSDCVFAPHFCYDQAASHFAAVHKVFGASNVSKLLLHLPLHNRGEAAITISYEALARMRDPVYGCVAHIFALQQQVANLQEEIEILGNHMATFAPDTVTGEHFGATNNLNTGLQFSSQTDALNMQDYLNQQALLLSHAGNATANQAFDSLMNEQPPPLYGWENQNLFCDSDTTPLERLFEGIDQEFSAYHPWFDNTPIPKTDVFQAGIENSFLRRQALV
ncbi:hypothetical protein PVL29_016682 [Vitis rotundifolia]|uniref:LOB domain-containing protein n=1 Tax=Vitis rotundifolia TaxID=103349 RepID=A0AA38Z8E9_VITRO|nr:hypothetical protein PVL29_016682 [Vitis rotundifolia]